MWFRLFFLCACGQTLLAQAAPHLALANAYQGGVALNQYMVSEKYDGVRAYWDGKQLQSRAGYRIHAPDFFLQQLPEFAVDGELWFGRHQFGRANALVKLDSSNPKYHSEWRQVRYMLFDAPNTAGDFLVRLAKLNTLLSESRPNLRVVSQQTVHSEDDLQRQLKAITQGQGEGLMLRKIAGEYRGGRSDDLLKLKERQDAEGVVIAHLPGQGKYQGVLGALLVRTEEGREIRVGSGFSDDERRQPPAIGSIITYRYQGYTSTGLPRFPIYWRPFERELTAHGQTP